jgi:hypothetical protein
MLPRELPRQRVDGTHPLHRHQEGLVIREPLLAEHGDLLAQMILQLRRVRAGDGPARPQMRPPCVDLLLQRFPSRGSRLPSVPFSSALLGYTGGNVDPRANSAMPDQIFRSAPSTVLH